ncbi:MAG TPA: FAD-dependent oxidoreductase, partial [Galbitalea sp.]|nr:FAD-dependent oxidoreductase [Galbitalea sp.]
DYGGSVENRARIVLEIGRAIRAEVGRDFPVSLKLSPQEQVGEAGMTPDRAAEFATLFHASGLFDLFSISGVYHNRPTMIAPMTAEIEAPFADDAATIKAVVGDTPIMVTGSIRTLDLASQIISAGKADLVGMTRMQIADPDLVRRAQGATGVPAQRRCVGANQGCWRRIMQASMITCTVNPVVGREVLGWDSSNLPPLDSGLKVLVVGAGAAGLEAAASTAGRGAKVVLIDRANEIGGALRFAGALPQRRRWLDLIEDMGAPLEGLGIETRLGVNVTPAVVDEVNPDVVLVATGASWDTSGASGHRPDRPGIPRSADARVFTPIEAMTDLDSLGDEVLIVDEHGTYTPLGLAKLIVDTGRRVQVLSLTATPGSGLGTAGTADLPYILPELLERGVKFHTQAFVEYIDADSVSITTVLGGPERLSATSVVLVMNRIANESLFHELHATGKRVRRIGDGLSPREVDDAIFEGRKAALELEMIR